MNIEKVIAWFKAAKPNPTSKDVLTQLGCHFEEIKEMCNAMNLHCDDVALQELRFKSACAPYLKGVESIDEAQAVEILDSLCDQIVTAIGVGYMMGFDMVGALKEVNLSNWSKFDENGNPIFNENGKIVKGENYFKPDLAKFLNSNKEI
nr:MAG TPA: NTP-PPase-like protein [Caudoviricetes sp.]